MHPNVIGAHPQYTGGCENRPVLGNIGFVISNHGLFQSNVQKLIK